MTGQGGMDSTDRDGFRLGIREKFFPGKVVRPHRVPREDKMLILHFILLQKTKFLHLKKSRVCVCCSSSLVAKKIPISGILCTP